MKSIVDVDLSLLDHDAELDLLRGIAEVPGHLAVSADQRAPHRITHAAQALAARMAEQYPRIQREAAAAIAGEGTA